MFQPLRRALDEQYRAFRMPQPAAVEGCACCTTQSQLAALIAVPREELSATALDFYARKAMTTVGGSAEFRYFWPRLAELAVRRELTTDREIVFGKPFYGEHRTWPAEERAALEKLARALSARLGAESLPVDEVEEWVCALGLLVEGLTEFRPLLSPLLRDTKPAWQNLLVLVDRNRTDMKRKKRLSNPFWEAAPESAAVLFHWLVEEPRVHNAVDALDAKSATLYGTSAAARQPHTGS